MLPLHHLADETNWQRLVQAERHRPGRRYRITARAATQQAQRTRRWIFTARRVGLRLRA
jgi:hypothetical protein